MRPVKRREAGPNETRPAQSEVREGRMSEPLSSSPVGSVEADVDSARRGEGRGSNDDGSMSSMEEQDKKTPQQLGEQQQLEQEQRQRQQNVIGSALLIDILPPNDELKEMLHAVKMLGLRAEQLHIITTGQQSSPLLAEVCKRLEELQARLMQTGLPQRSNTSPTADGNTVLSHREQDQLKQVRRSLLRQCVRLGASISTSSILATVNKKSIMQGIFRDHMVQTVGMLPLETLLETEGSPAAKIVLIWIVCIVAPHCKDQLYMWDRRYIPLMRKACGTPILQSQDSSRADPASVLVNMTLDQVRAHMKRILFLTFVHESGTADFWQHVIQISHEHLTMT